MKTFLIILALVIIWITILALATGIIESLTSIEMELMRIRKAVANDRHNGDKKIHNTAE